MTSDFRKRVNVIMFMACFLVVRKIKILAKILANSLYFTAACRLLLPAQTATAQPCRQGAMFVVVSGTVPLHDGVFSTATKTAVRTSVFSSRVSHLVYQ